MYSGWVCVQTCRYSVCVRVCADMQGGADLAMNGHLPCIMICFSEKMCSCWRVSTMCFLRRHLRANVLVRSVLSCTYKHTTAHSVTAHELILALCFPVTNQHTDSSSVSGYIYTCSNSLLVRGVAYGQNTCKRTGRYNSQDYVHVPANTT